MPQGIPMQFLYNGGERHVVMTSFTHIDKGLQQILFFKNFSGWKVTRMLKLSCFKQNQNISGMSQGIPMQFFTQQW